MPDAKETPKPTFWQRLTAPYRRLSLPARASFALGLFLVLLIIVAWVAFALNPIHVMWRHAVSWPRVFAVLALAILAPITFYWTLRLWLIGYRSRFPEIDVAWNAGQEALKRHGISIESTPLFLVLGVPSMELEDAMVDACGREFSVRGIPEGPAPMHWYANGEAIYVVCSEVGWLSRINRVVHQQSLRVEGSLENMASETQAVSGTKD